MLNTFLSFLLSTSTSASQSLMLNASILSACYFSSGFCNRQCFTLLLSLLATSTLTSAVINAKRFPSCCLPLLLLLLCYDPILRTWKFSHYERSSTLNENMYPLKIVNICLMLPPRCLLLLFSLLLDASSLLLHAVTFS